MTEKLDLAELEVLYSTLSPEERDELLQCLLVAASDGSGTVVRRLEECLLELAVRELVNDTTDSCGRGT